MHLKIWEKAYKFAITRDRININILNWKKMAWRAIKSSPQVENFLIMCHYLSKKNLSINEWVRHNGGGGWVRSKNWGIDKTSIFWPNISKILSKCITELAQDKFSFTFPCLLFQSGFELMYRGSGNTIPFSFLI